MIRGAAVAVHTGSPLSAYEQGLGVYLARRIVDALGGSLDQERGRLTFVLRAE